MSEKIHPLKSEVVDLYNKLIEFAQKDKEGFLRLTYEIEGYINGWNSQRGADEKEIKANCKIIPLKGQ
jgi:hypothetical protein